MRETDDENTPHSSLPVATRSFNDAAEEEEIVEQLSPEVTQAFEKLQEAFGVLLEDASYVSPSVEVQPMEEALTSPLFLEYSARPIASTSSLKQPTKISTSSDSAVRYASSDISSREIGDLFVIGEPVQKDWPKEDATSYFEASASTQHPSSTISTGEQSERPKINYRPLIAFQEERSGIFATCRHDTNSMMLSPGTFGPLVPGPQKRRNGLCPRNGLSFGLFYWCAECR
ncbi:hypothetical protein MRX96_022373 [Rhipicephalus microplus]